MVCSGQLVVRVRRDAANGADKKETSVRERDELDAIAQTTLRRCAQNDKSLHALDISDAIFASRFFSQLADALQHNTALQELYLDSCQVDDEALRVLSRGIEHNGARALRALSLEDNQIRCVGAGHLARLLRGRSRWARTFGGYRTHAAGPGRGLQYLSLKGNGVSAVGSKAFAEALACSDDSLERLSLEANRVNDWGAGWFAMALRNHNVLQCLDLHRNPIGVDGIEELKGACETAKASLVVLRPRAPPSARRSPSASGASTEPSREEEAGEDEEEQLVAGQRLVTVYVSEAGEAAAEGAAACGEVAVGAGAGGVASARSGGAFSRPSSASRRQGMSATRRRGQLDFEEPAGAVMADSLAAPVSGRGTQCAVEAGRPSSPTPQCHKVSAPGLSCSVGGADGSGALRRPLRQAAPLGQASTYSLAAGEAEQARIARCRPGERAAFAEEMETATALAPPSRWRRKFSQYDGSQRNRCRGTARVGGCGAAAVRGLRRANSAPGVGRRHGMLMGPHAAAGVYGCGPCVC